MLVAESFSVYILFLNNFFHSAFWTVSRVSEICFFKHFCVVGPLFVNLTFPQARIVF